VFVGWTPPWPAGGAHSAPLDPTSGSGKGNVKEEGGKESGGKEKEGWDGERKGAKEDKGEWNLFHHFGA